MEQELNLPPIKLRTVLHEDGQQYVFDVLRRKMVLLTPEEHIRQRFTAYLIRDLGYPAIRMANEVGIRLGKTRKRCDTVLWAKDMSPLAVMEYKAPHVAITQKVFDQVFRYNMALRVPYLFISNGLEHYCLRVDYLSMDVTRLPGIPRFTDLEP